VAHRGCARRRCCRPGEVPGALSALGTLSAGRGRAVCPGGEGRELQALPSALLASARLMPPAFAGASWRQRQGQGQGLGEGAGAGARGRGEWGIELGPRNAPLGPGRKPQLLLSPEWGAEGAV